MTGFTYMVVDKDFNLSSATLERKIHLLDLLYTKGLDTCLNVFSEVKEVRIKAQALKQSGQA